jgi:hypothetical protein
MLRICNAIIYVKNAEFSRDVQETNFRLKISRQERRLRLAVHFRREHTVMPLAYSAICRGVQ